MRIATEILPVSLADSALPTSAEPAQNWLIDRIIATPAELQQHYRKPSQRLQKFLANPSIAEWAGLEPDEKPLKILQTGVCRSAVAAFQQARANLVASYQPGQMQLSPVGSAYSVGRYLQGHPRCALRRPKTKLAPRHIEIATRLAASVTPENFTYTITAIALAVWDYHLAGGVVTLTVHYFCGYFKPNPRTGGKGFLLTLPLPIEDPTTVATFASVQFARAIRIPILYDFYGGEIELPGLVWRKPGLTTIWGTELDQAALQDIRVQLQTR
jgi:hypothetical protein